MITEHVRTLNIHYNVGSAEANYVSKKETLLMPLFHKGSHRAGRIGWLRAAVLGAIDGTISVASLVVGVAVAGAPLGSILLTGVAGLVAGAMSIEDSFKSKNIGVEVVRKGDPIIYGYRNEFAQVLLNILNNASDVLTERESIDPKVTVTLSSEGDRTVVIVADNGGGIPDENISKVFDPYFTTKGPQQGTGVGLYMSKTIIEKNMGGEITVRNFADGAEFRIEVRNGVND